MKPFLGNTLRIGINSVLENCILEEDLPGKFAGLRPTCLQTIVFYLFSFSNGVSQACQLDLVLSFRVFFFLLLFFSVPAASLTLSLGEGKRALAPP